MVKMVVKSARKGICRHPVGEASDWTMLHLRQGRSVLISEVVYADLQSSFSQRNQSIIIIGWTASMSFSISLL